MSNDERIPQLLYKHITGKISEEEEKELMAWVNANSSNRKAYDRLSDISFLEGEYRKKNAIDYQRALDDMKQHATGHDQENDGKSQLRTIAMRIVNIAAVVVLIAGAYLYYQKTFVGNKTDTTFAQLGDSIRHGTTQATLTLDNGETIALGSDTKQNADLLAKAENGEDIQQLELTTPRGGEFKIVLEDGTEVWLNAESQLKYPETFGNDERRVEVTGEAYFKVAKDSNRPFYVETAGQIVRVYGTEFNVHSYQEDTNVSTTLVEGSIALRQAGGNGSELMLTPGHQALFDKSTASTNVKTVDTSVVTSWRNGRFVFEDQTLEQIMQTLSRWYDFDYTFTDKTIPQTIFMGSVPRYGQFNEVLGILEKCGDVKFRQKGRHIIISKR